MSQTIDRLSREVEEAKAAKQGLAELRKFHIDNFENGLVGILPEPDPIHDEKFGHWIYRNGERFFVED